jgi:hypothetical protein
MAARENHGIRKRTLRKTLGLSADPYCRRSGERSCRSGRGATSIWRAGASSIQALARSLQPFVRACFGAYRVRFSARKELFVKEPGLDDRLRDKDGEIQQKRGDTLNKNLPEGAIPEFSRNARLDTMRKETGKTSIKEVRKAAKTRKLSLPQPRQRTILAGGSHTNTLGSRRAAGWISFAVVNAPGPGCDVSRVGSGVEHLNYQPNGSSQKTTHLTRHRTSSYAGLRMPNGTGRRSDGREQNRLDDATDFASERRRDVSANAGPQRDSASLAVPSGNNFFIWLTAWSRAST